VNDFAVDVLPYLKCVQNSFHNGNKTKFYPNIVLSYLKFPFSQLLGDNSSHM